MRREISLRILLRQFWGIIGQNLNFQKGRFQKKRQRLGCNNLMDILSIFPIVRIFLCLMEESKIPFSFSCIGVNPLLARPVPEQYRASIQKEREEFLQDYQRGIEKNQKEETFSLKSGKSVR